MPALPWQTYLSAVLLVLLGLLVIDKWYIYTHHPDRENVAIFHPVRGPHPAPDTPIDEGLHVQLFGRKCTVQSTEYVSSDVEKEWLDNVLRWDSGTALCREKQRKGEEIEAWSSMVASMNQQALKSAWRQAPFKSNATTQRLLSRYSHKVQCGTRNATVLEWIEPLYSGLRHPKALCGAPEELNTDRSHLLLVNPHTPRFHPKGKAFLFDLGATVYQNGSGDSSSTYLINAYMERGIKFDQVMLWEVSNSTSRAAPHETLQGYQYFPLPLSAEPNSLTNPLQLLKKTATPQDFVVFKLDVHNEEFGELEGQLIEQIMKDPELYGLIDEFYYEHHVWFEPMNKLWLDVVNPLKRLPDSYKLFHALRTRGIRAHSWPSTHHAGPVQGASQ